MESESESCFFLFRLKATRRFGEEAADSDYVVLISDKQ